MDLLGELLEPDRMAVQVVRVTKILFDQYVHPGKQERHVGARLDRQPVLRLAGWNGESRIDGDQHDVTVEGLGERLDLAVVQVLTDVRAK